LSDLNSCLVQMPMLILKDKKAAKKIIKLAKKHPDWYTEEEVKYAKQFRWRIKQEQKQQKEET